MTKGKNILFIFLALFVFATIGVHRADASYGGLDWVTITGPNELTVTYEHTLASYDATPYSNLGLGLTGRSITDVVSNTDNTITLSFDGPPVGPNTTGSIDIAPLDWGDFPGGFLGGTAYPVDDGIIPKLGAVTLQDNDNSDGLTPGDTLAFRFNEPMAQDITTENIDSYFAVGDSHTFGTAAHGLALSWNTSVTTLTVTIASDNTLAPGDAVFPLSAFADVSGNIMNNMPPPLDVPFTRPTSRTLYFYNATPYSSWFDVLNWWNDPAHTEQASSMPTAYDDVIVDSTVNPEPSDDYYIRSLTFPAIPVSPDNLTGLNFSYLNINASNGIAVHDNWNFSGAIVGDVTFSGEGGAGVPYGIITSESPNYVGLSNIIGAVTFEGLTNANYGTIYGPTMFSGEYGNAGLIYGPTEFNDFTSNPGLIFGHTVFRDSTSNGGLIHGDVDVYSPVNNPLGGECRWYYHVSRVQH